MCFSAPASFIAATLTGTAGILSVGKASNGRQKLFASIPLLFAIQQFSEAFVWLALTDPGWHGTRNHSITSFLFFAQVVWPVFVALSVLLLEKIPIRRILIICCLITGLWFSFRSMWGIFSYPVDAFITFRHIEYIMYYPNNLETAGSIAYFASTVMPLFISSFPRMRILAVVILLSFIVSRIWFTETLISVWCYFAAIASLIVHYILQHVPETGTALSENP